MNSLSNALKVDAKLNFDLIVTCSWFPKELLSSIMKRQHAVKCNSNNLNSPTSVTLPTDKIKK